MNVKKNNNMKQRQIINRTSLQGGMRRAALIAAAMLIAFAASAQAVSFKTEANGKMLAHANEPQFIGTFDGSAVLLDRTGKKILLGRYDMAQNELASIELTREKETSCYGGFVNGNNIDLLMVRDGDEGMRVWRERLNATTLQGAAEPLTLTDMRGEKKDKFFFQIGTSPNQELLAGVSVAARKGLEPEMRVSLYSRELEAYWHMPIEVVPFNQILVTDSGEVVLAYCSADRKRPSTFTVIDGEHEKHFSFKVNEGIWALESSVVRYGNGKLVMAVTVCDEHKVVMPLGSNINRVEFYCYDIQRDELTVNTYDFTADESARMANRKDGNGTHNNWVQFGTLNQSIADDEGAYLMLDQTWRVTKNDIPVEQHHQGMMVIRIDASGHVQWTRTMRLTAQSSWGGRDMVAYRWRSTADGVMLAAPQNAKNAPLPDDKPVKNFKILKDKAVMSVFTLDRKGNLSRENFDIGKQTMIGAARAVDSRHFMLLLVGSGNKSQFAHIELN